jgi:hypothetical protein
MTEPDFVSWALSPERSLEEAFCAELLVDFGRNAPSGSASSDCQREHQRRRRLNPAHRAVLDPHAVHRAAQNLASLREIHHWTQGEDRPLRDLSGLRFCPQLRRLKLGPTELPTLEALRFVPDLEELTLQDDRLEDYSGLAHCQNLRKLQLWPGFPWCNMHALAELPLLEELVLHGNLPMLEGTRPLRRLKKLFLTAPGPGHAPVRDIWMLPDMPLLQEAHIEPLARLDGIERFAAIEELAVCGLFRDLTPLGRLPHLRKLTLAGENFQDMRPLARLEELRLLILLRDYPLDLIPLLDAPRLREVRTSHETQAGLELDALNVALGGWDCEFGVPQPRLLEPALFRIVDLGPKADPGFAPRAGSRESPLAKTLQEAEGQWLAGRLQTILEELLRETHWGEVEACASDARRCELDLRIYSLQSAHQLRQIVEACRGELAAARNRWTLDVSILLEADWEEDPATWKDEVQEELEAQIATAHDCAQRRRQYRGFLERLHRFKLREELGQGHSPEEFAPPEMEINPCELLSEQEDWTREQHPLADEYFLMAELTEAGLWVYDSYRSLAERLLGCRLETPPGTPTGEPRRS